MNKSVVYIMGFMSSGKTTLGKKLAAYIGWNFYDLDHLIEEREQRTISDIFALQGEGAFREMEKKYLREISPHKSIVSVGGGTPCFFDNLEYMQRQGRTVYVKVPVGILTGRLKQDQNRPLVKHFSEAEKVEHIKKLYAAREPYYEKAEYIIDGLKPLAVIKKEFSKWVCLDT